MRDHPTAVLRAFQRIAECGSFTRAAHELEVTASALSQTLRQLEARLGVRLLHRTTRRVGLTEAGRDFLARINPALTAIDDAMESAQQYAARPSGTLRLTTAKAAMIEAVIPAFLEVYPEITLDVHVDNALTDLIAGGFDAGIRIGERLERDMVAMPLTGPMRSRVAASPSYLARHGTPQHPHDLQQHNCIRQRFASNGATYRWEFAERGRWFEIDTEGNLIANESQLSIAAARAGLGLVHLPEPILLDDLNAGHLVSVLDDWLPPYDGLYLYYPSRFHVPPKLRVFIDFVRDYLSEHIHPSPQGAHDDPDPTLADRRRADAGAERVLPARR
ncbi:LysR family transcriptional regulator [Oleiagrimonas sp. C23AA]|uniref:LysR family transcriptional regulator n=1 Tax=Oleiagrimonas sp. C23AA TaxID=2719047 RepID=UPI00141E1FBD|nr:LysR family transcriptional regulator [Oleiagrimonas sp. C23AA]NII09249.1 LysR family transcriptional regulator [Oleiagrimonas sp. C23AA]